MNIKQEITDRRRRDIIERGHAQGLVLPGKRGVPLNPFPEAGCFVICEVKRASPSRGEIAPGLDPVVQAGKYIHSGVRCISVLTEQNYFKGALADLIAVKEAFPEASVLRKDFLVDEEDLRISYRAGADAVLLIASLLEKELLERLYRQAESLGMTPLVEIHSAGDRAKVADLKPRFTGINSRDLTDFRIDPLLPLKRAAHIDFPTRLIYESGISNSEGARLAFDSGFSGILVGESAVRNPKLPAVLAEETGQTPGTCFYGRLFSRSGGLPLVKICGLTRLEDIQLTDELGADLLGFILAESPRRVDPDFIRGLPETRAMKVAVVLPDAQGHIPAEAESLLDEKVVDVLQIHGEASPEARLRLAGKAFEVRHPTSPEEIAGHAPYPRILFDKALGTRKGGTGHLMETPILEALEKGGPYWLAGGLSPENIANILDRYHPELVDASSRLESAPGVKDPALLTAFFKEISHVR